MIDIGWLLRLSPLRTREEYLEEDRAQWKPHGVDPDKPCPACGHLIHRHSPMGMVSPCADCHCQIPTRALGGKVECHCLGCRHLDGERCYFYAPSEHGGRNTRGDCPSCWGCEASLLDGCRWNGMPAPSMERRPDKGATAP